MPAPALVSSTRRLTKSKSQLFQKDAILRQMREYKRDKGIFESRVNELAKQATYHDDHIRLIDAWFLQVRSAATQLVWHPVADFR